MDTETGQVGLSDGYPICRFELPQFQKRLAHADWARASDYFHGGRTWQGNDDMVNLSGVFVPYHDSQELERATIAFASTFGDRDVAYQASSWGIMQLMGFNHAAAGYDSAEAMARAFISIGAQVQGWLRWAESSGALEALQRGDLLTFAEIQNGPGQKGRVYDLLKADARKHGWDG